MLSINTNISSLIAQHSMSSATAKLNQAIERMTTGFKINHAKDNAANYSIATDMSTKINSYMVAEDNAAMGLDMASTINDTLDLINDHAKRIRDLCEQASNGTYGEDSMRAIQAEIDSRMTEIERIKSNAEFNGIKLFEAKSLDPAQIQVTGSFIEEVTQLTEEEAIAQGYTIIKTADELQAMKDNLSGKYILMNDIDLSGYNWTPVGTDSNAFSGELNGNGFVIKNLTINNPTGYYQGLFGYISGGTVKNLGIEDADIVGHTSVGILVGCATSSATEFLNLYVTGSVFARHSGGGGIIGIADWGPKLSKCYSNIYIHGFEYIGGLVGEVFYSGVHMTDCYSKGSVSGDYVGGLIGGCSQNNGNYDATISNSYTTCSVTGNNYIGEVVGNINGSNSSFNNVYYIDQGFSGGIIPGGSGVLTSKTTSELQTMINNGALVSAKAPLLPVLDQTSITLQVGISSDTHSQISMNLVNALTPLSITISDSISARDYLIDLDKFLLQISDYQTELGAVQNRLESVLEEITIQRDNLISSRSTIRDADIADESSRYIQQQILQQASATLLATANQSPSIALQLI